MPSLGELGRITLGDIGLSGGGGGDRGRDRGLRSEGVRASWTWLSSDWV